jgi:hypothetical protein
MIRATDISMLGLSSYEHDRCFLQQIKCISYFYIVNVFNELLYWLLGMYMLDNDEISCAAHQYILVETNFGSVYMFYQSIAIILYTGLMFHIFYRLPCSYNLVAYQKFGMKKINPH